MDLNFKIAVLEWDYLHSENGKTGYSVNIGTYIPNYMVSHLRRLHSLSWSVWESQ